MVKGPRPDGSVECRAGLFQRHRFLPLAGGEVDPGAPREGPRTAGSQRRREGDAPQPPAVHRGGRGDPVALAQGSRPLGYSRAHGPAEEALLAMTPFHGIFCPMLTPLNHDETIDQASMRRLIDFLIDGGVHGIWVMGTTGEFPLLLETERARAVALTVEYVASRVPVIANVGDNSTALALRHARHAVEAGVDALACTPPHYYLHSMDEVMTHYRTLKLEFSEQTLFIYNIPQMVKVRMTLEATLQLAREGTASGIKDSQNDLQWFRALAAAVREERRGAELSPFLW